MKMSDIKMQSILIVVILGVLCSVSATPMYNNTEPDFSKAVYKCFKEQHIGLKKTIEIFKNITFIDDTPILDPDSEEVRCVFACAFKKIGVIDDEGKLDSAKLLYLILKYAVDDSEDKTEIDDFFKTCHKINDEPVSDGNKGCQRTGMLLNFFISILKS